MSLHLDDGNQDIYTHAFPLLEGGEYTHNGNTFTSPGYYYTDGCGNDISFTMAAAIFSFSAYNMSDLHDPASGSDWVKWPELIQMYDSAWGVYNHGLVDAMGGDYYCATRRNHSYVKRKMLESTPGGPEMKVMALPYGDVNYIPVAFGEDYDMCMWMQSYGVPSLDISTVTDWEEFEMGLSMMEDIPNLHTWVDNMSSQSANGSHRWGAAFSHLITSWNFDFNVFKSFIEYTGNNYGKDGLDNIWMAIAEEVYDYQLVRNLVTIDTSHTANALEITFEGELPADLRFYALSLAVESDASITNIQVDGGSGNTWSVTDNTALINLNWDGFVAVPPEDNAETYVSIAEQTLDQCDVDIAVDYVLILEPGQTQNYFKGRLCALQGVTLPDDFCLYSGLGEVENAKIVRIFPNPCRSILEVSSGNLPINSLELYSIQGKLVLSSRLKSPDKNTLLDLSHLPGGYYFVKIWTSEGVVVEPVSVR